MRKMILILIFVLFIVGCIKEKPTESQAPLLKEVNVTGKIIVFSDSDKSVYYNEFVKTLNNEKIINLQPEYFERYKDHSEIIILGIKESKTKNIILKLSAEFNENRTFSLIKKDLFSNKQKILIYYSATEDGLLGLIKALGQKPNDISSLVIVQKIEVPLDNNKITGNVLANMPCEIPSVTMNLVFQDSIIFPFAFGPGPEGFDKNNFLRIQVYTPFSSSTFKDISTKSVVKEVKDYAKAVVDDFKTEVKENLIKLTAVCNECGQKTSVSLKPSDYQEMDTQAWLDNIKGYGCSECPGSNVSLKTETIDLTSLTQDFVNERVSPETVLDNILGKQDDFYDSLPKSYQYIYYCPDYYVTKWVIMILMPVYIDMNKEIYKPEFGEKIDFNNIYAYSVPLGFNMIGSALRSPVTTYTSYPDYAVYNKAKITSNPEGVFSNSFFYYGAFNLSAPKTKEINGIICNFDYWEISGEKCCPGKNEVLHMDIDYVEAVAYYTCDGNLTLEKNISKKEPVKKEVCYDSDGYDIWEKGYCNNSRILEDSCGEDFGADLYEYYCSNDECNETKVNCAEKNAVCYDGRCIHENEDGDYDGFTDIDEYKAGTDPSDETDTPSASEDCDGKCKGSNYLSGRKVGSGTDCVFPEIFKVFDSGDLLCCCTPKTPAYTCTDSDDGKYPFIFGTCEDSYTQTGHMDICIDNYTAREYYCNDEGICESYDFSCGTSKICLQGYCQTMNI